MARTPGCKCSKCFGLKEFMGDRAPAGLPDAPGHEEVTLRVVTTSTPDNVVTIRQDVCVGGYLCECIDCTVERHARVSRGKGCRCELCTRASRAAA